MESASMSAVIAAVAAVVGGLLTAFATRSVERLRLRASLLEKAQERRLAGIEGFMLATSLWMDWLTYPGDRLGRQAGGAEPPGPGPRRKRIGGCCSWLRMSCIGG